MPPPGPTCVVVTGAHRSGTTVVGDLVSQAPGTWTVWEPLNQHWGLAAAPAPYRYLPSGASHPALDSLEGYLRTGRGRWAVKTGRGGARLPWLNRLLRQRRRQRVWAAHRGAVPVVKDPFLLLALGAVQPRLTDRPVVVTVRHPCSWLLSLRRVGWPAGPELNTLLEQEQLYEEHLRDVLPRRDWRTADDLDAAATAWTCLYHLVGVQQRLGADVELVTLERFGAEPVTVMRQVLERLGLHEPDDLAGLTRRYTGAGNAVSPDRAGQVHLLSRDSRALSQAWRERLSPEEVARVRDITEPVYSRTYRDWDDPEA